MLSTKIKAKTYTVNNMHLPYDVIIHDLHMRNNQNKLNNDKKISEKKNRMVEMGSKKHQKKKKTKRGKKVREEEEDNNKMETGKK